MNPNRYAYLIGANGPPSMRLKYAENDVIRLAEALKGPYCQFTAAEAIIAHSRNQGLANFQEFAQQCKHSDVLLVHFSGHAIFDGQLFLLCNDTNPNNLIVSAIEIDAIKRILYKSSAGHKLLILDCCHAKGAYEDALKGEDEIHDIIRKTVYGSSTVILSACARKDRTREFDNLDGGSGFLSWAIRDACSTHFVESSSDPEQKTLSLSDLDRRVKKVLDEFNATLPIQQTLPSPYLLKDQTVGYEIWLTPPPASEGRSFTVRQEENQRKYLRQVYQRYNSVNLPISPANGLSLHGIFQPLALRGNPLAAEDLMRKQRRQLLGEPLEKVEEKLSEGETAKHREKHSERAKDSVLIIAEHGEDALTKSPQGRIVILGGPGTGKTTTLKYLVSRQAQKCLDKEQMGPPVPLPIFISLADLARSGKTLQSYLIDVVEDMSVEKSYTNTLWTAIEKGNAFIAFDSLDEVTPAQSPRVIELINSLASEKGNIWIVGSRFTEYKNGQLRQGQFSEWELLSMNSQRRQELANKLFWELCPLITGEECRYPSPSDFVQLLEKHPQAAAWGENPLLFSLAAVVFVKTGGLPSSQTALYSEVIEAVLMLRERSSVARKPLLRALTSLSLWLYKEKKGRTFTLDDLFIFLEDVQHRSWEEAKTIAKEITNSGMLDIVAYETYGFRHQTFQEYLAAVELAHGLTSQDEAKRKDTWELAWNKRTYSRWTEVLRLMVGVLAQYRGRKGSIEAIRWLELLIAQRTTEEGDPGDLGLTLVLISLVEVANTEGWKAIKKERTGLLEKQTIFLWMQELLDAAQKQREARVQRFQKLTTDIIHLDIVGKEEVVKLLVKALRSVHKEVQNVAIEVLKSLTSWIPTHITLSLLTDPDADVRWAAVQALGNLGERTPVDALLPLLADRDADIRWAAVQALGNLGERTPVDALLPLLADRDADVRQVTVDCLKAQKQQLSIALLQPFFYSLDKEAWQSTASVIEVFDEQIPSDLLFNMLVLGIFNEDQDGMLRVTLDILKKQKPEMLSYIASQAQNLLEGKTFGDFFETYMQVYVAAMIDELNIASTVLLEKLTELLDWPHWIVRIIASQALGKIRRNIPDSAIRRLLTLRKDADPLMHAVKNSADDALAEILSLETGIEDE